MKSTKLTTFSLCVSASGAAATVGFNLYAGTPSEPAWWKVFVLCLPWMVSPYCVLAAMALRCRLRLEKVIVIFAATLLVTGFAVYVVVVAYFVHPDAQSGISFILVPGPQLLAAAIAAVVAAVVGRISRTRMPPV